MKIGVMLPISDGDGPGRLQSFAETVAFARAAEDGGLDSAWLADHLFYRDAEGTTHGLHEAWTWLTGVAATTSRLELGHLVVCTSFRPPTLIAKLAVTLDAVSGGRFTLGLGCGWYEPEYRAMGLPFDHRVGRFEEALDIIGRLLAGERVTFHGRWYDVDEAELAPKPDRRIPILVAAGRDRMIDLTARHADAWNTAWYGAPNDRLAGQVATFDAALERVGRTRADVVPTVGVNVRDPDQPPPDDPDPRSFTGSTDELVEVLAAYERLGVGHLMVGLEPMTIRSVERLADAVRRHRGA